MTAEVQSIAQKLLDLLVHGRLVKGQTILLLTTNRGDKEQGVYEGYDDLKYLRYYRHLSQRESQRPSIVELDALKDVEVVDPLLVVERNNKLALQTHALRLDVKELVDPF
jgi:hypothetical protein